MNWTLFGQIAGLVISMIGIAVMVVLFLLPRREKVKIKIGTSDYKVDVVDRKLTIYTGYELQRAGGKEIRYTAQIVLKPVNQQTYSELGQYFDLPTDGLIRIGGRIELPRNKIVSSYQGGVPPVHPTYAALPGIQNTGQWGAAQQTALKLSKETHKVRLVWQDGGKTKWKIITQKELGKWVQV